MLTATYDLERIMPIHPAYDPSFFRQAGHQLVDRLADHLAAALAGRTPVMPDLPPVATAARYQGPLPRQGAADPLGRFGEISEQVIGESLHLHHPGCMGHQVAPTLPAAALADLLSAVLNQSMAVYETGPGGTQIERQTVRWLAEVVGYGPGADGVFTSGGSLGNLTALLAARNMAGARGAWAHGVGAEKPMAVLVSAQAHYSIARATGILGLGEDAVFRVATDDRFCMDPAALASAHDEAVARGYTIMAVVGSACTTATGSYDPLEALADFCAARNIWFHVDGAHGASVLLSPRYRHLAAGIERADSVVWDAHKTLLVPSLATAVLFKQGGHNLAAFSQEATYLFQRDDADEALFDVGLRTVECTKRMLALKLWTVLELIGADALGEMVAGLHDAAREMATLLEAAPDFELLISPMSNILCFRHRPDAADGTTWTDAALDAHQAALRARAIASGEFYLVQTRIAGRLYLRVTIMNVQTGEQQFVRLLALLRDAAIPAAK